MKIQSIMQLTISGDTYYFNDNGMMEEQRINLQKLANTFHGNCIVDDFIDAAKEHLDVDLIPVVVSFVIRINR